MAGFKPVDARALPRFVGIPTFFRVPHVTDPTGLDVAILGVPYDGTQASRVGSRYGPAEIRRISCYAHTCKPIHLELNINIYNYLKVADLGDSPVNPLDPAVSREWIQESVARIVNAGAMPISVGGDHSITLPILRAVALKHGPVGLIQVDAHTDWSDNYYGSKYGAFPFRRAVEEGLIDPKKWVQIGIRGSLFTEDEMDFGREHGVRTLFMDKIYANGIKWALEQLDYLRDTKCYFTFDIDGMDAAFAPGTTGPVPGGLTSMDALVLMRYMTRFPRIVGFDLVEVQPLYDPGGMTCYLAATLIFEFLATRAVVRRDGP